MRIEPDDYERMRTWLGLVAARVFPPNLLRAETDPMMALDRIASKSAAKARSGLGTAIGDIVELTSDWPPGEVSRLDDILLRKELPTLTEVRSRFSKVVQRVVRRGRIKDDEEFYAVRNAVEQPGADESALWSILETYEAGLAR